MLQMEEKFSILNKLGVTEGNVSGGTYNEYAKVIKDLQPLNVLEIGFNAGHSAVVILENSNAHLTSVDIGDHSYVYPAQSQIAEWYPGRHTLIVGDSRTVIPTIHGKFDLIIIDGGHYGDVPSRDLSNCRRLAHKDTVVIMDDVCPASYGIMPSRTWEDFINKSLIIEKGRWLMEDKSLGIAWGVYV